MACLDHRMEDTVVTGEESHDQLAMSALDAESKSGGLCIVLPAAGQ